ncbi:hypothetical protein [Celeribacter baekdonensis]|uniref:hypothetical protein n=1 Tax=Celeribacter baekdonensis TaxID=875171 RepID=UPI0030DADF7A|tara:strand:- start:3681 stop:4064 length:384 start_codon:yes stop_codon:yes gene_type:complete
MTYTRERFAMDLRHESVDRLVDSYEKTLRNPPGRKPASRLGRLSKWYSSLDEEQQQTCLLLMEYIAEASLFSTLAALDGASLLSEDLRGADIRLTIVKGDDELLISSSEHGADFEYDLHELMFPTPD